MGEARALRLARLPGYRRAAWSRLGSALAIDTPDKNIDTLRREAAACLGDFLGNEPLVRKEQDSWPVVYSWFPDSQRVAVALASGDVSVRTIETNQEIGRLERDDGLPPATIRDLQVAPDGQHVAALAPSGAVEVWQSDSADAWNRIQEYDLPAGEVPFAVRFLADGRRILICSSSSQSKSIHIRVRGLTDRTLDRSSELAGDPLAGIIPSADGRLILPISISPDGRLIAGRLNQTDIGVWSTDTGALEHRIHSPFSGIHGGAFTPDGSSLVVGEFGCGV